MFNSSNGTWLHSKCSGQVQDHCPHVLPCTQVCSRQTFSKYPLALCHLQIKENRRLLKTKRYLSLYCVDLEQVMSSRQACFPLMSGENNSVQLAKMFVFFSVKWYGTNFLANPLHPPGMYMNTVHIFDRVNASSISKKCNLYIRKVFHKVLPLRGSLQKRCSEILFSPFTLLQNLLTLIYLIQRKKRELCIYPVNAKTIQTN